MTGKIQFKAVIYLTVPGDGDGPRERDIAELIGRKLGTLPEVSVEVDSVQVWDWED